MNKKDTLMFMILFFLIIFQVIFVSMAVFKPFLQIYAMLISVFISFTLIISFATKIPQFDDDEDERPKCPEKVVMPSYADIDMQLSTQPTVEKPITDEKKDN